MKFLTILFIAGVFSLGALHATKDKDCTDIPTVSVKQVMAEKTTGSLFKEAFYQLGQDMKSGVLKAVRTVQATHTRRFVFGTVGLALVATVVCPIKK